MTHIGLFEGIGGFSLAARWAGWRTPVMVEWNPYCQAVLRKNFPYATIFGDIHEFDGTPYRGKFDVLTGGFPCQPYSHAGKRAGNDDKRALWPEMLRVITEVAPPWVIGENVAGLLTMDGGRVLAGILADLENAGYRPEIYSIPAIAVGAPHQRERIWIVAHRDSGNVPLPELTPGRWVEGQNADLAGQNSRPTPDSHCLRRSWRPPTQTGNLQRNGHDRQGQNSGEFAGTAYAVADADLQRRGQRHTPEKPGFSGFDSGCHNSQWSEHWLPVATRLCRMDDGLPARMDGTGNVPAATGKKKATGKAHRLEALGNAIVPHIAYEIFMAIQATTLHPHPTHP